MVMHLGFFLNCFIVTYLLVAAISFLKSRKLVLEALSDVVEEGTRTSHSHAATAHALEEQPRFGSYGTKPAA
jgi:hypothetical protein